MSLSPCPLKEAFIEDMSGNNFVKDYDDAAYEHKYLHEHDNKDKKHEKEWFETEQGMIYIAGGVAALILIVIVLHKMRK